MAVIELVDKVTSAAERNESTLGIFLDLSKAFDTIDRDILLYELEYYTAKLLFHQSPTRHSDYTVTTTVTM